MDYQRYTLYAGKEQVEEHFQLSTGRGDLFQPNYNVTPGTTMPIIRSGKSQGSKVEGMPWGITLAADDGVTEQKLNIAKEDIKNSSQLARQFQSKRCIIPANGFYQWKVLTSERKLPFYIRLLNEELFGFAGIFSEPDEEEGYGFAILTTEANPLIQPLHTHMPAILHPDYYSYWIHPENNDMDELLEFLQPYPTEQMSTYRVAREVDDPSNNGEKLIKPVD